jgi:hypothetical protein
VDRPAARTRVLAGLRVDEHPRPDAVDRIVAELRTDVGESHERPHQHGISHVLLTAARTAADLPGVEVAAVVTLERSALRFAGPPTVVAAALAAATAAFADPSSDHLAAARRLLAGAAPQATTGSFARARRFGTEGHGLTGLALHAIAGASDDDVRSWARFWHGGTTHVTVVGELPDFDQHLPPDGPTLPPVPVANARTVPGTADWSTPAVGLTWLAGSLPEDRATAVLVVDRLRGRLAAGVPVHTEVELLEPGTQHVTVSVWMADGEEDGVASTALRVLDDLATDGPTGAELARAVADAAGPPPVPEAVAAAAGRARDELLLLLPGAPRSFGDLPVATLREPARLEGAGTTTLRAALWTRDRRSRIELHPDGVRLDREDLRLVADRRSVVALMRRRDGTRTLQLRDGRQLDLDPAVWRDGQRAVDHVDATFADVAVDAPPAGPPPARLVAAARSPRWIVAAVAGVLFLPFGVAATFLALQVPAPGRFVLVPLALLLTVGVIWVVVRFVRERFAAAAALRARTAARGADPPGG